MPRHDPDPGRLTVLVVLQPHRVKCSWCGRILPVGALFGWRLVGASEIVQVCVEDLDSADVVAWLATLAAAS